VQLNLLDLPVEEVAAANEPASDLPPADAPPVPAEDAAAGEAAEHDETDPPPGGATGEERE
jgi:hypothetical protein